MKKRCVIVSAGDFTSSDYRGFEDFDVHCKGDYIIAADGGYTYLKEMGIIPDLCIGDFDSLGFAPGDCPILRLPVEKDCTDTDAAIRKGLEAGCTEFLLLGMLGGSRLSHTLANLQSLQFLSDHGAVGYLIGEKYIATVVKNGTLIFPQTAKGILSVFCMGQDAEGVTLSGLKYELTDGTLTAGFPLGVSNHFTHKKATISVNNGSLLLLFDRENGLPIREDNL